MLKGDATAFDRFFDTYFPRLFRFALARVENEDTAEELAQSTLCQAMAKLETYRGEASLFTWLCTFCRHELSAHYKKLNRHGRYLELIEEQPEVRAALESLSQSVLERGDTSRLVQMTLDHLPPKYGDVLEWKYIHGLSVKEISERMELGPKAVESLLTRARRAFRDSFVTITNEVPA